MHLLTKALRHPERALLRLALMARLATRSAERERARLLGFLSQQFGVDVKALRAEFHASGFASWFRHRLDELQAWQSPYRLGTTPHVDCEVLYLAIRAARPQSVVETGVLYGASSAHILAALEHNGEGTLYSIELGREPHEPPHDFLVPPTLKKRWKLIIGDSRRELPTLLRRLKAIDFFHHDSAHTFDHMRWEYETAFRRLRPGGVLSSDDVLVSHSLRELRRPNAFSDFCARHRVISATFGNVGLAVKPGAGQ